MFVVISLLVLLVVVCCCSLRAVCLHVVACVVSRGSLFAFVACCC